LQNLAEEIGWKKLVTLPELLHDMEEGKNDTRAAEPRPLVDPKGNSLEIESPVRPRESGDLTFLTKKRNCFLNPSRADFDLRVDPV